MPKLEERKSVTCFLESDGEILIMRRSGKVVTYRGSWGAVSGYLDTTADEQALVEIREEASLYEEDLEFVRKGEPLPVEDEKYGIRWIVHPYLFRIKDRSKIKIDWEHE